MGSLAACHSKANKQARLVERKVCFISDAGNCRGGWWTSVQRLTPHPPPTPTKKQGVREFTVRVGGRQHQEIAQSSLTVIFRVVISGLTGITLVVLRQLVNLLEKEMATHSSILAWRIPRTEERGGLQSMGSQESDTTE